MPASDPGPGLTPRSPGTSEAKRPRAAKTSALRPRGRQRPAPSRRGTPAPQRAAARGPTGESGARATALRDPGRSQLDPAPAPRRSPAPPPPAGRWEPPSTSPAPEARPRPLPPESRQRRLRTRPLPRCLLGVGVLEDGPSTPSRRSRDYDPPQCRASRAPHPPPPRADGVQPTRTTVPGGPRSAPALPPETRAELGVRSGSRSGSRSLSPPPPPTAPLPPGHSSGRASCIPH